MEVAPPLPANGHQCRADRCLLYISSPFMPDFNSLRQPGVTVKYSKAILTEFSYVRGLSGLETMRTPEVAAVHD
jgi:hypothetical protein